MNDTKASYSLLQNQHNEVSDEKKMCILKNEEFRDQISSLVENNTQLESSIKDLEVKLSQQTAIS